VIPLAIARPAITLRGFTSSSPFVVSACLSRASSLANLWIHCNWP